MKIALSRSVRVFVVSSVPVISSKRKKYHTSSNTHTHTHTHPHTHTQKLAPSDLVFDRDFVRSVSYTRQIYRRSVCAFSLIISDFVHRQPGLVTHPSLASRFVSMYSKYTCHVQYWRVWPRFSLTALRVIADDHCRTGRISYSARASGINTGGGDIAVSMSMNSIRIEKYCRCSPNKKLPQSAVCPCGGPKVQSGQGAAAVVELD